MANRARQKGTAAESAVVAYLQVNGWPYAERRALNGSLDKGDVAGCPGLAMEVKSAGAGIRMGKWVSETNLEKLNAKADHGILVIKPWGSGLAKVDSWFAVMVNEDFNALWTKVVMAPVFTVYVVNDPPAYYSEKDLKWQLSAKVKSLALPNEVMALTLRPPGTKDNPDAWYRVLTLQHMVKLLHAAGYGDSTSDEEASGLQIRV